MVILSEADNRISERATTIPRGSTLQAIGSGSREYPMKLITCSNKYCKNINPQPESNFYKRHKRCKQCSIMFNRINDRRKRYNIDNLDNNEKAFILLKLYLRPEHKCDITELALLFNTTPEYIIEYLKSVQDVYNHHENYNICNKCHRVGLNENFGIQSMYQSGQNNDCKDCTYQRTSNYYKNNKDHILKRNAAYVKEHPEVCRISDAKRRARLKQAMPFWADQDKIAQIYETARKLELQDGIMRHVDHIVPLCHDKVCGLHVPENLQILTQHENNCKYNNFEIG